MGSVQPGVVPLESAGKENRVAIVGFGDHRNPLHRLEILGLGQADALAAPFSAQGLTQMGLDHLPYLILLLQQR